VLPWADDARDGVVDDDAVHSKQRPASGRLAMEDRWRCVEAVQVQALSAKHLVVKIAGGTASRNCFFRESRHLGRAATVDAWASGLMVLRTCIAWAGVSVSASNSIVLDSRWC
jgi:hypothetical protein